jgi:hypothetical protein
MNLAVLTYQYAANPRGIPDIWPAKVIELGEGTELPDINWVLMTSAGYISYLEQYQSLFDAWLAANPQISGDKSGTPIKAIGHMITCGVSLVAEIGRYLELVANNPTSDTPFVATENCSVTSMSIFNGIGSTTGTISLYKNKIFSTSISLAAEQKNRLPNLSIDLVPGDQLSWRVTEGSFSRVNVYTLIQSIIDV